MFEASIIIWIWSIISILPFPLWKETGYKEAKSWRRRSVWIKLPHKIDLFSYPFKFCERKSKKPNRSGRGSSRTSRRTSCVVFQRVFPLRLTPYVCILQIDSAVHIWWCLHYPKKIISWFCCSVAGNNIREETSILSENHFK